MTEFLQLALALVILISAAKLGGYISLRLGQPSVLGELIAGLILGPSLLDLLHHTPFTSQHLDETIALLAELGVLLLMFLAGLELHIQDLAKAGKVSALAGTLGVIFPVAMGFGLGRLFGMEPMPSLFVGLVLAATSVSISAQTLMELGVLRSRVGIGLLGAAVFDDVLVILGLSIILAMTTGEGGLASVGLVLLSMTLYLVVASALGVLALPRLARRVDKLPVSQGLTAFVLVTLLLFAWAAEALGSMAAITGAFMAGLFLSRSPLRERIQANIAVIAYGLFVPIFFVSVGLVANARMLIGEALWLSVAMIAVAIVSKIAGAGLGARLASFTNRESLQLGVGMMSRGEVGLIVATLGVSQGLLNGQLFAGVVGVVIVTTLLTPPALRMMFARPTAPAQSPPAAAVEE
ncbi:MAG TPA: cation:proton antiporter [Anaerolineae bacterium]|mgnify:CR=1 FL=1|nr:cation:proton antiporter [Anaerolineae bacterium]